MDLQSQKRIYDTITSVLSNKKQIQEALAVVEKVDGKGRDLSQVQAMEKWLKPLKELLESSVSANAKQEFIREYSQWVRSFGQFYQAALRSNPGLSGVFEALEDSFNIQVKIQSGKNTKDAKEIRKESRDFRLQEAEGDPVEFINTFIEMVEKIPSSALKSRFAYQFERWQRENPTEITQLERNSPTIKSFLDQILNNIDPDIKQDVENETVPNTSPDETENKGV